MRDIRPDLRDRLRQISQEQEDHALALKELDERERVLKALLADEIHRWQSHEPSLFQTGENQESRAAGQKGELTLSKFLIDALGNGRSWSLNDLKAEIAKTDLLAGSSSPGRALNFALVGLARHGYVERLKTGEWIWKKQDAPSAETDEAPGSAGSA